MDVSQLPPITFAIVKPPRFKKLEEFKSIVTGLSFVFATMIFFALTQFGLTDYINSLLDSGTLPETVTRSGHGRMTSHGTIEQPTSPFYHGMMMLFTSLSLFLFGTTLSSVIQRFRKASHDKYQEIGTLVLSHDSCKVSLEESGENWEASLDQIQRIDCFFGLGVMPQTRKNESTFDSIQVIRVQFLRNGQRSSYYIHNSEKGQPDSGVLTHALHVIKKINLQYHRKIQFWDQF